MNATLSLNGQTIQLTEENFLFFPKDWSPPVTEKLAELLNVELTPLHWDIIYLLRKNYEQTQSSPKLRYLIETLRQNPIWHTLKSSDLYQIFTDQPLKQACQLAGLPKPPHCL